MQASGDARALRRPVGLTYSHGRVAFVVAVGVDCGVLLGSGYNGRSGEEQGVISASLDSFPRLRLAPAPYGWGVAKSLRSHDKTRSKTETTTRPQAT